MKKRIIGMALVLLWINSIASVRYGTFDCPKHEYKMANTFDYDDRNYKSRYMYTAMIVYKKRQPSSPYSDYYPVYHDSTPTFSGLNGCPENLRPCVFTRDWQAKTRTSIWEKMSNFIPNKIEGFHYWRKAGQSRVESRKSKAMECFHHGMDWKTGELHPW